MAKEKIQKWNKTKAAKPKYNMWQNSWFMIKLAWTSGEKKVIVLSLLSALLALALNLVNLYVSPTILSAVERHVSAGKLFLTITGFVLALMLVSAASAYVNTNTAFGRISVRIGIANLLNEKATTTSYPNVDDDKFKKLLVKSRECTYSSGDATEAIWSTLTMLTTNILGFLIYVSLLTSVQPLLILVIFATTLVSFFLGNYLNGYGYRHREEEAEYERQMNYLLMRVEDLTAAKDIRIFGLRSWIDGLYGKAMSCYTAFHKKAQGVYIWSSIADLVFTFLRNAIAYAFLISLVLRDGLGVAEFLLYFTATGGFAGWECVSFRYPGAEQDTLTNIDLTLHPGEKLAVVGLNGAGKTTLVKLICGFLDPAEGRVLLDGKDIRDYDRADYYTMFSAVFQDFSLLAGSIATNVAQSNVDIDMERVRECIEKAGLRTKVETLPDGYETYLNREVYEEATLVSGGETQRLMLARALYKNAPFIILDEPTAALDPIAEAEIYSKFNDIAGDKTAIYISHRLSSCKFCDRIVVFHEGEIIQQGTHDTLVADENGKYHELWHAQAQYYTE